MKPLHSSIPAGDSPSVRVEGLTKVYEQSTSGRHVLDQVSATFEGGRFSVLLGRSGSGKSTLLNLISGIDLPTTGQIWIGDVNVTRLSEQERTLFRRRYIGFVFQFFNLIPTLTAVENVSLPVELSGVAEREARRRAAALLERVGLGSRLADFPDRLSGGEQQRVAIARALANDPALILADEPTGNLDEESGDTVLSLLLTLVRESGKTLLMATHSLEIVPLADHVYRVTEGQLVQDEQPGPLGRGSVARMSPSLLRIGQRYLLRRPLQSILVVLGIALGVAVIVAIDLANGSASRAFALSTEAVSGRATHQIVGGPSGVPQALYTRLRREAGLREVAPVVSEFVTVQEVGARPMRLLGVDPFAEAPFRSYLGGGRWRAPLAGPTHRLSDPTQQRSALAAGGGAGRA